ncbi:hypothetical protein HPB52_021122 [Rhipicephalus sanguineus]|uniref:Uncharacterized protein n=1 Tax=Rhipicephalus sanguineus TaxID=34632 RepID=A0A9D4PSX0_RHISA|nr:hypothetical protein HPB52_021122 [Rhipicephalus sanguineus]
MYDARRPTAGRPGSLLSRTRTSTPLDTHRSISLAGAKLETLRTKESRSEAVVCGSGHGNRMCKILKAEWSRQARLYRIHLEAQLLSSTGEHGNKQVHKEFNRLASQATEFLWQSALLQLRAHHRPKKKRVPGNTIFTEGDVTLPEEVSKCLAQGPKFAVQPQTTASERLSLVRKVSSLAPASEMDREPPSPNKDAAAKNGEARATGNHRRI